MEKRGHGILLPLLFTISLLLLIGGTLILLFGERETGPLQLLEVSGNHYLSKEELIKLSSIELGQSYRGSELDRIARRLQLHPVIDEIEIRRSGSGHLVLFVEERECAAMVRGDGYLVDIDFNLRLLPAQPVRCIESPLLSGRFELREGSDRFEEPSLYRLVEGLKRLKESYPELWLYLSEIRINRGGGLTIFSAERRLAIELGGDLDDETLKRLYAAFAYVKKERQRSGVIDLRGPDILIVPEL